MLSDMAGSSAKPRDHVTRRKDASDDAQLQAIFVVKFDVLVSLDGGRRKKRAEDETRQSKLITDERAAEKNKRKRRETRHHLK